MPLSWDFAASSMACARIFSARKPFSAVSMPQAVMAAYSPREWPHTPSQAMPRAFSASRQISSVA